jgi:hypothetical protein
MNEEKIRNRTTWALGTVGVLELIAALWVVLEAIQTLSEDEKSRHSFNLWGLTRLDLHTDTLILILAMGAGIVGSFVQAATSYAKYHGCRKLTRSWIPWYLVRAPIGAALAVVLYLILRGGLVPSQSASDQISPLGVAGLAAMAGMFSNLAVERLEKIFIVAFGDDTTSPERLPSDIKSPPAEPAVS